MLKNQEIEFLELKDIYKFSYNYLLEISKDIASKEEIDDFINTVDAIHCTSISEVYDVLLAILQDFQIYRALNILETDPIFEKSNLKLFFEKKDYKNQKYEDDDVITLFKKLSSGQQVIMLTLIQLVDCITERSLVILDEPENHLHPPLLSAFIRTLSDLLIDRNGVAIVATHLPMILQEVPKSCVWKINRNGMEVRADRLDIESFGATIGALTREVFGLEVSQSGFHKILIDEVLKGIPKYTKFV